MLPKLMSRVPLVLLVCMPICHHKNAIAVALTLLYLHTRATPRNAFVPDRNGSRATFRTEYPDPFHFLLFSHSFLGGPIHSIDSFVNPWKDSPQHQEPPHVNLAVPLVSLEQDGATGSAQSRCKFQNTTFLESATLLHKRAAIEAIKGGAGIGMAPLTLSHLHLLWLAWQLRVRITKCFLCKVQTSKRSKFSLKMSTFVCKATSKAASRFKNGTALSFNSCASLTYLKTSLCAWSIHW